MSLAVVLRAKLLESANTDNDVRTAALSAAARLLAAVVALVQCDDPATPDDVSRAVVAELCALRNEASAAGARSQRDLARTLEAHAEALDAVHAALRRALDTVARCGVAL